MLTVLFSLLTGLAGLAVMLESRSSLQQQEAATAQLGRIQTIHAELLHADAIATSAHLQGTGQPEGLQAYDASLAEVSRSMISAGQAQPADRDALAALNAQVLDYARAIEQARSQARAGNPVGDTYLMEASSTLRSGAVPTLETLARSNSQRITQHSAGTMMVLPILLAVATLIALAWIMFRSARRFRRVLNPGLVTATVAILVILALASQQVGALAAVGRETTNALNASEKAASARIWANESRSQEVLSLIDRDARQSHDQAWDEADAKVERSSLTAEQQRLWRAYEDHHIEMSNLLGKGDLAGARTEAMNAAPFDAFDQSAAAALDQSAHSASDTGNERTTLTVLAIVVGLLTVIACGGSFWGLRRRTREYL